MAWSTHERCVAVALRRLGTSGAYSFHRHVLYICSQSSTVGGETWVQLSHRILSIKGADSFDMSNSTLNHVTGLYLEDPKFQQFLLGNIDEPEQRVGRRDVPDNRVRLRDPLAGDELWRRALKNIKNGQKLRRAAQRFDYRILPLSTDRPQIRLLRIRPENDLEAPMVCELCVMDLDKMRNKYEALSYCWGKGEPEKLISICPAGSIKGRSTICPAEDFPVRSNLDQALRHLRDGQRHVVLWVDAICINQKQTADAIAEKNRQLSMMSDIYNSAKNVCIWLGNSYEKSEKAFRLVNTINNFQKLDENLHGVIDDAMIAQWQNLVETLKETQWFSRRWIIQEIASAKSASVHFGYDQVHWDDLASAISLLDENCAVMERRFKEGIFGQIPHLNATQLIRSLTNVCRRFSDGDTTEKLLDLETLVCVFQQFQASFPQDIIHSVRALARDAPDQSESNLSIEHKKSTRDLFVAFVKRCIRQSGSLDIICRHWAPRVEDTVGIRIALPSWISDVSNSPFGVPGESHERQNGENFVAISPNQKWKLYNASGTWIPQPGTRLVPIAPQDSAWQREARWSTGNVLGYEPSFSPNLSESPSDEHDEFRFPPTAPRGQTNGTTSSEQPSRTPTTLAIVGNTPRVDEDTTSGAATSPSPNQADVGPSTGKTIGPGSGDATSVKGHKRSYTAPSLSTIRESSPKAVQSWNEILGFVLKPNGLALAMEKSNANSGHNAHSRQSSRSQQESHGQGDTEHWSYLPGHIHPMGFILGTVRGCSDLMRDAIVPGDWLTRLGWYNDYNNHVPELVWRMLVADRTSTGGELPDWYRRACLHCLKDSRLVNSKGDLNTNTPPLATRLDSMTSIYLKRLRSVIWRRRIIQAQSQLPQDNDLLFGLAPERCREGDIICIIEGCSVPVVLRTKKNPVKSAPLGSSGVYELIGEAYVHRKMYGEAVHDMRHIEKHQQTFTLE
jgi:hypothetical protein